MQHFDVFFNVQTVEQTVELPDLRDQDAHVTSL